MRRRRRKTFGGFIMRLIGLGILAFVLALCALCYAESHPGAAENDTDAIIVLGAQVYADGSLSPQLALRMEAALTAYRAKPRLIVACGAKGAKEPAPEGEAMRDWLIENGVPGEDILAETQSFNTAQNLKNARAMLPETVRSVTIVTSDYHLPRAMRIARDLGYEAEGVGSPCKPEYWVKNHSREVLAWGKYFLNKVVPLD